MAKNEDPHHCAKCGRVLSEREMTQDRGFNLISGELFRPVRQERVCPRRWLVFAGGHSLFIKEIDEPNWHVSGTYSDYD